MSRQMHDPQHFFSRRHRARQRQRVFVTAMVSGVMVMSVGSAARSATPDTRPIIGTGGSGSSNRVSMTRQALPPTVIGKRAVGAVYRDRVDVTFEVLAGDTALGLVRGVVDLATSDADLQYLSPRKPGDSSRTAPFTLRIRKGRIQVMFPPAMRQSEGVDGYVTSIDEGAYSGVGTENEVLLPIAILTGLDLPGLVPRWSPSTPGTAKKASATGVSTTGASPVPITSLTGTAVRSKFPLFPSERFGPTAGVDLRLRPSGQMQSLVIRFSPVAKAKKAGSKVIELRGTVRPSTKVLITKAPPGTYITAAKYFNLDPLPEFAPPSATDTATDETA